MNPRVYRSPTLDPEGTLKFLRFYNLYFWLFAQSGNLELSQANRSPAGSLVRLGFFLEQLRGPVLDAPSRAPKEELSFQNGINQQLQEILKAQSTLLLQTTQKKEEAMVSLSSVVAASEVYATEAATLQTFAADAGLEHVVDADPFYQLLTVTYTAEPRGAVMERIDLGPYDDDIRVVQQAKDSELSKLERIRAMYEAYEAVTGVQPPPVVTYDMLRTLLITKIARGLRVERRVVDAALRSRNSAV